MLPGPFRRTFSLALLLAALGCHPSSGRGASGTRQDARQRGVIPDSEVSINGFAPGDSATRVRATLGKPDSVSQPRRGISDIMFQTAYYSDLDVKYADGTVAY